MDKVIAIYLVALAALALGLWRGARVLRRHPELAFDAAHHRMPEMRLLAGTSAMALLLSVVIFSHYELLWRVPWPLDPWVLPVMYLFSGGSLLYLFTAGLRLAYRVRHPERHKLLLAAVLMTACLGHLYLRYARPVHARLRDERTPDGIITQTSGYSCAAAASANYLRLLGRPATEKEMARLAGTTILGTSPGEVIRALRRKGVRAHKERITADALCARPGPAILLVDFPGLGPLSHAVTYVRCEGDHLLLYDPIHGADRVTRGQLAGFWRGHVIR